MAIQHKEIVVNAVRWAEVAKRDLPEGVGFIMLLFPKSASGQGQAVCVGNVTKEAVLDELRAVLKASSTTKSMIWTPEKN